MTQRQPNKQQRNRLRNIRTTPAITAMIMAMMTLVGCSAETLPRERTTMEAELRIRVTGQVLNPVSDNLFGQFLEKPSWGNETGPEAAVLPGTHRLDPRVEAMLKAMEIPVVRFPGGTDVDYLDWRDMVTNAHGPDSGRPNSHARHQEPIVTNAFGYDEYGQLAERLGWKTILVVNLRDGLLTDKTPEFAAEHAAALLAYYTGRADALPEAYRRWPALRAANGHPEPYAVEYIQIGNETWMWTEEMKKRYGEGWIKAWADRIEMYIAAIRRVAPGVKLIADAHPLEVAAELARRKATIDLYAFHRYYPWSVTTLCRSSRYSETSARTAPASDAAYQDAPSASGVIGSFEGPTNVADFYDARYRGYVTAPQTGTYRFWIASDHASSLLLGTSAEPTSARWIAGVSDWTGSREWTKEAGQRSEGISLTAGQRYYIEARHMEENYADNLAVRWELPDGTIEEPIPGHRLAPFVVSTAPAGTAQVPPGPSAGILREVWDNRLAPKNVTAKQVWETLAHSTPTDTSGLAEWQDPAMTQARQMGYRLAMTEWNLNGWWGIADSKELWPGPGGCGLGAAVMLHAMLRGSDVIDLANQSMLVGKSWGIAGIRVAQDGVAPPTYAPTAEATTLYRKHHGDRRLAVNYETPVPLWNGQAFFAQRATERAASVDVLATRDAKNLYLHLLNTDYDHPQRIAVRLEGLPVAAGSATLHRLRFLTRDEVQPGGSWTVAETESVTVTPAGCAVQVPCRSATVVVLPLRETLP